MMRTDTKNFHDSCQKIKRPLKASTRGRLLTSTRNDDGPHLSHQTCGFRRFPPRHAAFRLNRKMHPEFPLASRYSIRSAHPAARARSVQIVSKISL